MHVEARKKSLPPSLLEELLEEPDACRALVERHAPYFPVQRYFGGDAEYRVSSGQGNAMIIAPNFRGDFAYKRPLVEGAEIFFHHPALVAATRRMFGADLVRPLAVYANLTWQLPFHQGGGHTDVPAFRGIDRTQVPIWLLSTMGHSALFEAERITLATAVAWFYRGSDGGFEYWPEGPRQPSRVHEGAIFNTAILGDNDRMYHRVRPVGHRRDGLLTGMTLDTALEFEGGDGWRITEGGKTLASFPYEKLRISVSWKAEVFRDAEELRVVDEHEADINLDDVFGRFYADLDARGIRFAVSDDPLHDAELIDLLSATYVEMPILAA